MWTLKIGRETNPRVRVAPLSTHVVKRVLIGGPLGATLTLGLVFLPILKVHTAPCLREALPESSCADKRPPANDGEFESTSAAASPQEASSKIEHNLKIAARNEPRKMKPEGSNNI